jgi:hypothetical protein
MLIAGTGRAGTSFLVRYLTKLGLDTHLSRAGADAEWDDSANAGLENLPLPGADLPYVIKSPWTYLVLQDVLARGDITFDAVVVPMRDLTEAASSRTIIETQSLHRKLPWMGDLEQTWEHYGHTPGGIVYSLNPVDQARLLALGFHQLLERCVRADIPVILLSFPRLIEDVDYLYGKLAAVLPETVSPDTARDAHAVTADPSKPRVRAEVGRVQEGLVLEGPGSGRLERAALTRALADVRREAEDIRAKLTDAITVAQNLHHAREADAAALAEMSAARDLEAERMRSLRQALDVAIRDRDAARTDIATAAAINVHPRERIVAMESAIVWRCVRMMQAVRNRLPLLRPKRRPEIASSGPE